MIYFKKDITYCIKLSSRMEYGEREDEIRRLLVPELGRTHGMGKLIRHPLIPEDLPPDTREHVKPRLELRPTSPHKTGIELVCLGLETTRFEQEDGGVMLAELRGEIRQRRGRKGTDNPGELDKPTKGAKDGPVYATHGAGHLIKYLFALSLDLVCLNDKGGWVADHIPLEGSGLRLDLLRLLEGGEHGPALWVRLNRFLER